MGLYECMIVVLLLGNGVQVKLFVGDIFEG